MARFTMLDDRSSYKNVAKYDMAFREIGEYCGNSPMGLALFTVPPTLKCRRLGRKFRKEQLIRKLRNKASRRLNLRGRVVRSTGQPTIKRNKHWRL